MNISKRYGSLLLLTFSSMLAFSNVSFAETTLVSVSSAGIQGINSSDWPDISADGRYVVFESQSSNLVAGDTNNLSDIFLRDTQTGTTTRVSVSSSGAQATEEQSRSPVISADGRYVAFSSGASNLVAGDTNDRFDVFLHDTQTGITTRVSVSSSGEQGTSGSYPQDISADGRYVAFSSYASNLVAGDTNGNRNIFLRDIQTGETSLVSVDLAGEAGANGSEHPAISANGRYVVFQSRSSNLVVGDTNGKQDVFLRDMQTGVTTRISVSSSGTQASSDCRDPVISDDGRYVVFQSGATDLVAGDVNGVQDIFLHDTQTGMTSLVSLNSAGAQAEKPSFSPAISGNGRHVVFATTSRVLVGSNLPLSQRVFLRDTQTNTTVLISEREDGTPSSNSGRASVSADGRRIAFISDDQNLLEGDTNERRDVFLRKISHLVSPGDCDGDGDIDIADVICTINMVLSGAAYDHWPDCDRNLEIDINDVICTINKVLG